MLALRRAGLTAYLVPFGENTRYDLVTTTAKALPRPMQDRTAPNGSVVVQNVAAVTATTPTRRSDSRPYDGEVDEFGVFCPDSASVYLIPIEDVPTDCIAHLRVDAASKTQARRIRRAAAYEIARVELY